MRYIVFLLLLLGGWVSTASGQIQFVGCGEVMNCNYFGETLYAIQDKSNTKPFGRVVFTPEEGGGSWDFSWTYNGIVRTVSVTDSVSLEVELLGDGLYTFQARRDGVLSKSAPVFHVFFDHVPHFSIQLTDVFNCKAISIGEIADFRVPVYVYGGNSPFEGDKSHVYYLVSDKSVPREFPSYEYAFKAKEEAIAVNDRNMSVTVTITDKFGFEWTSEAEEYVSVIPRSVPAIKLENKVDIVGEVNDEMGQAPLEVEFSTDECVNADRYEWLLYKDTSAINNGGTSLLDSLLGEMIRPDSYFTYIYENTGRYKVRLIAINTNGVNQCKDSGEIKYVNVIESLVDVPNVFTPNGDGKNDVFMVKALSVENFHAVILNRWGRKVYEWSDPQGGWDGRINGKYATPGTYYYIVTARGREKSNPPRYTKKGALMLIR